MAPWMRGWEEGYTAQRLHSWGHDKEASSRCFLSSLSGQLHYLENELRLGHHVLRLETDGHPFREWSHSQETRVAKLEKRQHAGAKKLIFRDLETVLWVKDLIISFAPGDTKG